MNGAGAAVKPIRVFVCDCQPIAIEGLTRVLEACPDLELAGAAPALEDALAILPELVPDLILMSEESDSPWDASWLGAVRSAAPQARLVLWTSSLDTPEALLEAGFAGVLDKRRPVSELLAGLRAIAQGAWWMDGPRPAPDPMTRRSPPRLTRRERDIVRLVAEGRKNREIALALAISPGTVKVHLMHIFEKAGVEDRLQLALLARRLLSQEPDEPSRAERARDLVVPV
jgi:DNA-binding NarL/FixJ family response regulator